MRRTLRIGFVLIGPPIVILLVSLFGFLYVRSSVKETLEERYFEKIGVLVTNAKLNVEGLLKLGLLTLGDLQQIDQILPPIVAEHKEVKIWIVSDIQGKVLYKGGELGDRADDFAQMAKIAERSTQKLEKFTVDIPGQGVFNVVTAPIMDQVLQSATGVVLLGMPIEIVNQQVSGAMNQVFFVMAFAGIVLVIIVILGLQTLIAAPIRDLSQAANNISNGDLTHKLQYDSVVEIRELRDLTDSFVKMTANLHNVFSGLNRKTDELAQAANQFLVGMRAVAQASENQFLKTKEMAVAIEEMASSVQLVSENAGRSQEVSAKASQAASRGGQSVQETRQGIGRVEQIVTTSAESIRALGERSQQIGQIIDVIKEISSQTNLLALNAAIEAARAGEHGRGFEVVASEVRKLAEKSTDSTAQITAIIEEILRDTDRAVKVMQEATKEVTKGTDMASRTEAVLQEIIGSNTNVSEMINAMADAARQQSSVSDEVANAVDQISRSAKDVSNQAEEQSSTVQNLFDLAEHLRKVVGDFKL